jgi:hypothetical protein
LVAADDDFTLSLDRVRVHGNTSHQIFAGGVRFRATVTNSVLEEVGFALSTTDGNSPGSSVTVAFSTIVYPTFTLDLGCGAAPNLAVRYENSIIAALRMEDAIGGATAGCVFLNTLLSRQAAPPSGTFVGDPKFVDSQNLDFHLVPTSPAVDTAVPSAVGLDPVIDFEGRPRPQGNGIDVGAFERAP